MVWDIFKLQVESYQVFKFVGVITNRSYSKEYKVPRKINKK